MNIKSLLLGSAVAAVAATGARAADAIIIAEPEPLEYVRICDVYGTGFFYIPGTQNCLKIGGYVRYQMDYNQMNNSPLPHSFTKLARFAPTFDVRSETEWGTLRAFAEVEFDWAPFGTGTNLNHAFIELQQANGVLRLGKGDTPYARFFGYGAGGVYGGQYAHHGVAGGLPGFHNSGELSYTFNGGNGFSAVAAIIEPGTGLFEPNFEVGAKFTQGWGSIGGMVGYDNPHDVWGAKADLRVNFDPVRLGVQVYYSSTQGPNWYGIANPHGGTSHWSVLAHGRFIVSDKLQVKAHAQWFDGTPATGRDIWQGVGGLLITPFGNNSLEVLPEIRYTSRSDFANDNWTAVVRFNRNF